MDKSTDIVYQISGKGVVRNLSYLFFIYSFIYFLFILFLIIFYFFYLFYFFFWGGGVHTGKKIFSFLVSPFQIVIPSSHPLFTQRAQHF